VGERVATVEQAAEAFTTLAEAEGAAVPMYARLCRAISADPGLSSLLLEAPVGQRVPVLVLAALHDLVLEQPEVALGRWFPSVGGEADRPGDLEGALRRTVDQHRARLVDRMRHRQVQTNEVNRCTAWRAALSTACHGDDRPLSLVEVGASAGLNLHLDRYRMRFEVAGAAGQDLGPPDSPVHLSTSVRTGALMSPGSRLPPIVWRRGLDLRPLDPTDPADARWLAACVWPEQTVRFERLRAALSLSGDEPAAVVQADLLSGIGEAVLAAPRGSHVVVLSSWVLAYVDRDTRRAFLAELARVAPRVTTDGGRLSLLTLEADHVVPWLTPDPLPPDAPAEQRHASLLGMTALGRDGTVTTRELARCQAHLTWMDLVATPPPGGG
jgi:hypothetical protein